MSFLAFILAITAFFLEGMVTPHVNILAFAPFIALIIIRHPFNRTLWISASTGTLVDLFSDDPIGLHALNYTIIAALLYRFRKHFSDDQPLHLSLFTVLISFFSTLVQLTLLFLFDRRVPFHGKWGLADLIGMPVIDGLYAFIWFAAPLAIFEIFRKFWVLFWLKKKNRSPISH